MAGGLWIVTGTGAAVGGLAGSGGAGLLFQLGSEAAKPELVRLQVMYDQVVMRRIAVRNALGVEVIQALRSLLAVLKQFLVREEERNEKGAKRVTDCSDLIQACESAIAWLEEREKEWQLTAQPKSLTIQWQFYDSPTKAAIMAMGMG